MARGGRGPLVGSGGSDDEALAAQLGGMAMGVIAVVIFVLWISRGDPKIEECQKELPRDEQCVLVAVPESDGG